MNFDIQRSKKIVVLGQMTKHLVAGVVWQTLHYLLGFKQLGYDVYYVEAHASMPTKLMVTDDEDVSPKAAAYIKSILDQFDLGDKWCFQALHNDGACYGLSESGLLDLYASAELIVNLHGATAPRPEHYATNRLLYLETDPVALQLELYNNLQSSIDFLEPHFAFFTFGENYGGKDCRLPISPRFHFSPTRQPVAMDLWKRDDSAGNGRFTTIGNWQQLRTHRSLEFQGELYHWSKHFEFLKFLDLPHRTGQEFELALSSYTADDRSMLESNGWRVRDALSFSLNMDSYRSYIVESRGEFTVAKDQNIRLRTGWFSDRAATYLAAGRPVITQETGFTGILPTGNGLFGFQTLEEAADAVERINADYNRHCAGALAVAREYFDARVVLGDMLQRIGMGSVAHKTYAGAGASRTPALAQSHSRSSIDDKELLPMIVKTEYAPHAAEVPVAPSAGSETTQARLVRLTPPGSRVLIVGAVTRGMTQALVVIGCRVVALMPESGFPTGAAELCERTFAANLNAPDVLKHLAADQFDVIIVDLAEFAEPAAILRGAAELLLPEGTLITLAPNANHVSLRLALMSGRAGGLGSHDGSTRLFDRASMEACISSAGLAIEIFERQLETADSMVGGKSQRGATGFFAAASQADLEADGLAPSVRSGVISALSADPEAWTRYFIAVARPIMAKSLGTAIDRVRKSAADRQATTDAIAELRRDLRDETTAREDVNGLLDWHIKRLEGLHVAQGVRVESIFQELNSLWERIQGETRAREELSGRQADIWTRIAGETTAREELGGQVSGLLQGGMPAPAPALAPAVVVPAAPARNPKAESLLYRVHASLVDSLESRNSLSPTALANQSVEYRRLVFQVRGTVKASLPSDAKVAIVSKGDEELLKLDGCSAWHFPQTDAGVYAGHYPADSTDAVSQLEKVRAKGAEFLIFPKTSLWWLEYYADFRGHLEQNYHAVVSQPDVCTIYALR